MLSLNEQTPTFGIGIGVVIGLTGGILALTLVVAGPVMTFAALLAFVIGIMALSSLEAALIVMLGTVAIFPFGTLPFKIAITPSLIDITLGVFLVVYLFQWMTGRRYDLYTSPVQLIILLFVLIMVGAFVFGLKNGALTSGILRRFVGLMANILLALVIVDVVRTHTILRRVTAAFMLFGVGAALIGIILWLLNDLTAEALLNRLGRIGYPVGGVIRYREDGVSVLNERAIGTWVDPNAYGGFLMMVGALTAPQLIARKSVLGNRLFAFIFFGLIGVALFLSDSRGSMLGLMAAVGAVAVLRYRKLFWLIAVIGLLSLLLPPTQAFLDRLYAGFTASDLETQMRFGEYKDAINLIQRYPILGVGFIAPPDIDEYLAVASTYLTIAGNAGLIGLTAYFLTIGSVFFYGYSKRHQVRSNDEVNDLWFGLLAGILGAMVSSIFDHFYFNIDFQATSLIFWLYIGLFLATIRIATHRDEVRQRGMPLVPHIQTSKIQIEQAAPVLLESSLVSD